MNTLSDDTALVYFSIVFVVVDPTIVDLEFSSSMICDSSSLRRVTIGHMLQSGE